MFRKTVKSSNFGGCYCVNAMLRMPNWTREREQWVQIPQSETDPCSLSNCPFRLSMCPLCGVPPWHSCNMGMLEVALQYCLEKCHTLGSAMAISAIFSLLNQTQWNLTQRRLPNLVTGLRARQEFGSKAASTITYVFQLSHLTWFPRAITSAGSIRQY